MSLIQPKFKKILIPVLVLVISVVIITLIFNNKPSNQRGRPQATAKILVETKAIQPQKFEISISSYGVVQPKTQSVLVSQVAGQVSFISENFRDGGFFNKGEVLVKIDARDYQAEVKIAKAALINAQQVLLEEQARSKQALEDWQRLGNGSAPGDLVLRKPQLAAQQANVLSAQAKLDKAELAIERTQIIAPYSGRVLKKQVDYGQVINSNSQLADIYATDYVEVRLPINNRDLAYLNLPEQGKDGQSNYLGTPVTFTSTLIGEQQWQGKLVRTESAIDDSSQQLYVVAQIEEPFKSTQNTIKIGQYVNAEIRGKTIENALLIPNEAIYQGSYVYILQNNNLLKRVDINFDWQNSFVTFVSTGLNSDDHLVITPLGQVSSGTPVTVLNSKKESPQKHKRTASNNNESGDKS